MPRSLLPARLPALATSFGLILACTRSAATPAATATALPAELARDAYGAECPPPALEAFRREREAEIAAARASGQHPRIVLDGPGSFLPSVASVFFDDYLVLPNIDRRHLQAGLDSLGALDFRPADGEGFLPLPASDSISVAFGVCPGVGVIHFRSATGTWAPPPGVDLPRRVRSASPPR